jgi:hypothetical protein
VLRLTGGIVWRRCATAEEPGAETAYRALHVCVVDRRARRVEIDLNGGRHEYLWLDDGLVHERRLPVVALRKEPPSQGRGSWDHGEENASDSQVSSALTGAPLLGFVES